MGMPAAAEGDLIEGISILIVMVPEPAGEVPVPMPFPYSGPLVGGLSDNVLIGGKPAATLTSTAENEVPFEARPRPGEYQVPPSDTGTIVSGSPTVLINSKPAAREGDTALIAEMDAEAPAGVVTVVEPSNVLIGE